MDQKEERISLAGKTFDYWKVQDDFIIENNRRKWLCECRCGTLRYVNEQNLISKKSRSCGCLSVERTKERIIDLTGQEFGFLKVLSRAPESRHGRVCWICLCQQCGNECIVTGHELRQKKTKSCGCLKKIKTTAVDLTDQTFGRLIARYPTEKRDRKGSVIWHCTCACGGEIDVSQDCLKQKRTKSCGCLKKEAQANLPGTLHYINGTCVEFLKRKRRCDNSSGHTGVYLEKDGRYRAAIGFKKKRYNLGIFDTFEAAVEAREKAEDAMHKAFLDQYDRWMKNTKRVTYKEVPDHEQLTRIAAIASSPIALAEGAIKRVLTAAIIK